MGRFLNYVLGGSTSPMAGDGRFVSAPIPKSPSHERNNDSELSRPDTSSVSTPQLESLMSPKATSDEERHPTPQRPIPKESLRNSSRSPDGVGAPRISLATPTAAQAPEPTPRPNMDSFQTTPELSILNEYQDNPNEVPWESYEIPGELRLLNDDTPQQIRDIVQESMDEHQAMWVSRLQAQEFDLQVSGETTRNSLEQRVIAESSTMASARLTPDSQYSYGSSHNPAESVTSLESNAVNDDHLQPPKAVLPASTSASEKVARVRARPSSDMTEMERKFHESRSRMKKTNRLFNVISAWHGRATPSPEASSTEPSTSECTSCFDDVPDTEAVALPCRHKYCSACFAQLISTAIQHEANFPPKCCLTDVPKRIIRDNLPGARLADFDAKSLEYAVPIGDRYYCVSATCGGWIDTRHAQRSNGSIVCPHCASRVCTSCRGQEHPANEDCPQDRGLDRTLEQAERAGWRRCYNCRAMVELRTGCRHITCTCRAEFCYTCGAVWHTCRCTEADQALRETEIRERLARFEAEQRAEEEELRRAMVAVEAAERRLREEHEAEERRMQEEERQLARLETERLAKIAVWFGYLRDVLDCVQSQQKTAIEKRHDEQWVIVDDMKIELRSPEKVGEREAIVNVERETVVADTESTIKSLKRKHATAIMETSARHRKDQEDLSARFMQSDDPDADIQQAEILQQLMPVQDLERSTLISQQTKEIQKWRSRGEASLQAFDAQELSLQMGLDEIEKINKREREVSDIIFADGKWCEVLLETRLAMLAEDERKMKQSGGEAPEAPKRDKVTLLKTPQPVDPMQARAEAQTKASSSSIQAKPTIAPLLESISRSASAQIFDNSLLPAPLNPRKPPSPRQNAQISHPPPPRLAPPIAPPRSTRRQAPQITPSRLSVEIPSPTQQSTAATPSPRRQAPPIPPAAPRTVSPLSPSQPQGQLSPSLPRTTPQASPLSPPTPTVPQNLSPQTRLAPAIQHDSTTSLQISQTATSRTNSSAPSDKASEKAAKKAAKAEAKAAKEAKAKEERKQRELEAIRRDKEIMERTYHKTIRC